MTMNEQCVFVAAAGSGFPFLGEVWFELLVTCCLQ